MPKSCWSCSIPKIVSYADLLKIFWEAHDPTQGMRQGNDVGTTYRSAIYTIGDGAGADGGRLARCLWRRLAQGADAAGSPPRSRRRRTFYFAEEDHQQYLAKNPYGYCGLQGHRRRLRRSASRRRLSGTVLRCRGVSRTAFPKGQNSA